MRPLAFHFKEVPQGVDTDFSQIEYDPKLNLSVSTLTGQPAIDQVSLETETFTKSDGEAHDSDRDGISILMDTSTSTRSQGESSDSDLNQLSSLLDTATVTLIGTEATDSDADRAKMLAALDTSTLTESTEVTDQDKDWK